MSKIMVNSKKLSPKQDRFCLEYLIDLNATQAAIRAGYSAKTANRIASQLLSKLVIQQRISELKLERNERLQVNADYILNRLVEIDQMDIIDIVNDNGTIKPLSEWPKTWRQHLSSMDVSEIFTGTGDGKELTGMLKKIRWPDKLRNLETLGKHCNVRAFDSKKNEHSDYETCELPEFIKVMIQRPEPKKDVYKGEDNE